MLRIVTLLGVLLGALGGGAAAAAPSGVGHLPSSLVCPDALDPGDPGAYPCVRRDGATILVPRLLFDYDKATLRHRSHPTLEALAELLRAIPAIARVEIQGHRDDHGERHLYGRRLTQERAAAVRHLLIERGVAPGRLEARGYGAERPLVPNDTRARRAKNRRIEAHIRRWEAPPEGQRADGDCAAACAAEGLCEPYGDVCLARDGAACAASAACRERGACAQVGPRCAPGSDADCARTDACARSGACAHAGLGVCVVGEVAHCRTSQACQDSGACSLVDGRCGHATDEDCRRSPRCASHGECAARTRSGEPAGCVARRRADCRSSAQCAAEGLCSPARGRCVALTNRDCRGSTACRVLGRCTRTDGYDDGGSCVIGSNHDCRRSEQCTVHGRCARAGHFRCQASSSR